LYRVQESGYLATFVRTVSFTHGACPDASGNSSDHGVFRVHTVAEEKAQVGRELINAHSKCQVVLDDGRAVAKRKGQLAYRIRSGFGGMLSRYSSAQIFDCGQQEQPSATRNQ
jgi:hypothetical protein